MAVVWPSKNNFANGDVLTAANMNNIADTLNVFNPTSATNGQVWVANGTGGGAYGGAGGWTSLTTGTITSQTQVNLTGFSQNFKHLELWVWAVNLASNDTLRFDGFAGTYPSAGTTTTGQINMASATTVAADGTQSANGFVRLMLGKTIASANTNNFFRGTFYNYSSTTANKTAFGVGSYRTAATYLMDISSANVIQTTGAALTTIRIDCSSTITSASYILWGIS